MVQATVDEIKARFKRNHKTREMVSHSSKVHSVDWSCDGKKLASGEQTFLENENLGVFFTLTSAGLKFNILKLASLLNH